MQESVRKLRYKPVLGPDLKPICLVKNVIIDPATGKFLGFTTVAPIEKIVISGEILLWQKKAVVLGQEFELSNIDNLPRIAVIMHQKIRIIGARVTTVSGQFLGKVTDFYIDTQAKMLSALVVKKMFLKIIPHGEKIIHYQSIVEINKNGIIVKDAFMKIPIIRDKFPTKISKFAT